MKGQRMAEKGTRKGGSRSPQASDTMASTAAIEGRWVDIPPALPPIPKTLAEATRRALLANPGKAAPLEGTFTTRKQAEQQASTFRRARPKALDPEATGTYQARAYETEGSKWGVIVWYDATAP